MGDTESDLDSFGLLSEDQLRSLSRNLKSIVAAKINGDDAIK